MTDAKKPFRILSLDGGGIRGIITARILKEVESQLGGPLGQYFDMIAGTSTGSLIAGGIAVGMDSEAMMKIYQNDGLKIFPYQSLFSPKRWKLIKEFGLSAPKFSRDGLEEVVRPLFRKANEDILMKDVGRGELENGAPKPILLILAYDCKYRNTTFFTNYRPEDKKEKWFLKQPLWQICVSSASAPTFFPAFQFKHSEIDNDHNEYPWDFPHVDGGVTANNPALCAISRAIELGHDLKDIHLLSIGTGQNKNPLEFDEIQGWGLMQWGMRISDVFMEGQGEVQDHICRNLLKDGPNSSRYLRLQFDLNQPFDAPPHYLAQAPILKKNERRNELLHKHLIEEMDNASKDSIDLLLEAAEKYLTDGKVNKTRFSSDGPVKSKIAEFFKNEEKQ